MDETPPLLARARPLVLFGLGIAAIRFAMDVLLPQHSMWFGVYYAMPVALLVVGVRKTWAAIRWPQLLCTMALVAVIVFGAVNAVVYTAGQFFEWQHGRFYNGGVEDADNSRAGAIAATTLGKIGQGLLHGGLSSITGTIWCTAFGTVFIWLPGRLRKHDLQPHPCGQIPINPARSTSTTHDRGSEPPRSTPDG